MFHKTEPQPINYIQILPRRGSSKTLVFWDAAFLNPVNDDSVIMLLKYSTQNSPLYSKRQRGKSSDIHMCYVNWLRIPKKHRASPNPLKSYVGELHMCIATSQRNFVNHSQKLCISYLLAFSPSIFPEI